MTEQKKLPDIKILDFSPELQPYFEALNRRWIEAYFEMESADYETLQNAQTYIIDRGGAVLFAESAEDGGGGIIVGAVALKPAGNNIFELAKMAVAENYRGRGIGEKLCRAALEKAALLGARKVILYTNSILEPALRLYRRIGFVQIPLENSDYERSDIKMEIDLETSRDRINES